MEVGDTVTLEVEVSVEGYMTALPNPVIDFADIEISGPQVRSAAADANALSGVRTYIYRLVATTEGSYEIPAVEMSFFDPESASYGTTRTGRFRQRGPVPPRTAGARGSGDMPTLENV